MFSHASRSRGEDYALTGRVRLVNVTPTLIEAVVRGSEMYAVHLSYDPTPTSRTHELEVSCTCPYFEGGADTCKHLWATLVAASNRPSTFLTSFETAEKGTIELVPAIQMNLEEDEPARGSPGRRFVKDVTQGLAASALSTTPFRYAQDELIYVIDLQRVGSGGVQVELLARERRKDGGWRIARRPSLTAQDLQFAPREDAEIMSALLGAGYAAGAYGSYQVQTTFPLPTHLARILIPMMAKTGRTHIRRDATSAEDLHPVSWDDGPPWRFRMETTPSTRGDGVVLSGRFERNGEALSTEVRVTALESGFLITPTTIARAALPKARALFVAVLRAGPIALSSDETASLAELLAKTDTSTPDLPEALKVPEIDVAPQTRLSLRPLRTWALRDHLEAAVTFDYDGTIVDDDGAASAWDPAKKRLVRRRGDVEAAAIARLEDVGVVRRWHQYAGTQVRVVSTSAMPAAVRALVAEGWLVEADGRIVQRPSRVSMSVSSGIDWFDLAASVEFAGESVPLTEILAALKRGDSMVPLGDGSKGLLPERWLERYASLAALGEAEDGKLRFRLPQTALLDALLAAQEDESTVTMDAKFQAARQALARFDRISPADAPATFHGTLRPYQKDGLGWLGFLRQFGFGGCLADDMGLGKTVMVLAMLDAWRRDRPAGAVVRPSLVVAPRSVVHNWIA